MRSLIVEFIDHIAYERGLSANTRAAYEDDLTRFADFLERRCAVSDFSRVTRDHVAGFLDEQRRQGLSAATRARRLVAVKVLFGFLCAEGRVPVDITRVMASPAKGRQLPKTLSEAEIAKLLASVSGDRPHDVRDRSMLELLYACGLRVSELIALHVGDIRFGEGVVRCIGKGDKQRVVPCGAAAVAWLQRYLAQARPRFARGCASEHHLFLSQRGQPFTRQGVFAMLAKRARSADIGRALSPHVLRHCFASHLLAHGAQIRAIQEMLGHADIATTQIYTHVDEEHVTRTHARYHPRH